MKRKHKKYSKPKRSYEKVRMEEENKLVEKYGLKNKREIWKAIAKITYFRTRAKKLFNSSQEEQNNLIGKLKGLGFKVDTIPDILGLDKESLLKRRLSTVVNVKGFAKTPKQARQLVTHKKILIDGKIIDSPSYIVSLAEENKMSIKPGKIRAAKVDKKEEEIKEAKAE